MTIIGSLEYLPYSFNRIYIFTSLEDLLFSIHIYCINCRLYSAWVVSTFLVAAYSVFKLFIIPFVISHMRKYLYLYIICLTYILFYLGYNVPSFFLPRFISFGNIFSICFKHFQTSFYTIRSSSYCCCMRIVIIVLESGSMAKQLVLEHCGWSL